MSLGSRELFHSDFLSWLFETYPPVLKQIFGLTLDECVVERERKHLDMVIRQDSESDPVLIIENKVKSYPEADQLARYALKFPAVEKRVLLTLFTPPPSVHALSPSWETLHYEDLAEKLRTWRSEAEIATEHHTYIDDYILLISNLAKLSKSLFEPDRIREGNFWFRRESAVNLVDIGFQQSFTKFQAQVFRNVYLEKINRLSSDNNSGFTLYREKEDIKPEKGNCVKLWWALFNNMPCVCFEPIPEGHSASLRFEVQVQGSQYRRLIAGDPFKGKAGVKRQEEEAYLALWNAIEENNTLSWLFNRSISKDENGKFFNVFSTDGAARRRATSMQGDLCQYKPDVVYQYVNISADGSGHTLELEELAQQIHDDLKFAFDLLRTYH